MAWDIWFYAFWLMYFLFLATVYYGFAKKIIKRLTNRTMFLHYHFLDTGDNGDMVFTEGANIINGSPHTYRADKIKGGTLYYTSLEVEPLEIERNESKYTYFCLTNEFDIVKKQDVLETLLIFNTKGQIIGIIVIMGIIILLGILVLFYFTSSYHNEIITNFAALTDQVTKATNTSVTQIRGRP